MKQEVEIKCISNLAKNDIELSSEDYLLEYPAAQKKIEYAYVIPPLLIYINDKYKPVFGKSIIDTQIKRYGKVKLALVIYKYKNNYTLFQFLLFIKRTYLGLNSVEKSFFLNKFRDLTGDIIYKDLDLPKNIKTIEGYKKLVNASNKIKKDLVADEINELTLFEIFSLFDKEQWEKIEDFVIKLKIGTKKRIEIINMIYDIIQRDNIKLESLINSEEIKNIFSQKIDPPQKGEKIFTLVYEKRYPEITKYKKKFYGYLKSLKLDKNIHIELPPNFEKWEFKINFHFRDLEEFKNRLVKLQLISENKDFKDLLKMRF